MKKVVEMVGSGNSRAENSALVEYRYSVKQVSGIAALRVFTMENLHKIKILCSGYCTYSSATN